MFFCSHLLFVDVCELCLRVLPEGMKDLEWNDVRTGNPVHIDITNSLIAVGVSHELAEKTGGEFVVDALM